MKTAYSVANAARIPVRKESIFFMTLSFPWVRSASVQRPHL
jgi:hypothetical protein